jgi:hypothetical protein
MLANLVQRLNSFIETCFDKLVVLCISKQQEAQIKDVFRTVKAQADSCCQNVHFLLNSKDDSEIEDECARVQEVYKSCFASLEMCFEQLLGKIYQIESETFKNYKFKDTVALLDLVM